MLTNRKLLIMNISYPYIRTNKFFILWKTNHILCIFTIHKTPKYAPANGLPKLNPYSLSRGIVYLHVCASINPYGVCPPPLITWFELISTIDVRFLLVLCNFCNNLCCLINIKNIYWRSKSFFFVLKRK